MRRTSRAQPKEKEEKLLAALMGERLGLRQYCDHCHYPQTTCLCEYVEPIASPCQVHILQHPRESAHRKNTARLVPLVIKQAYIHIGKSEQDFNWIASYVQNKPAALIYPNQASKPLEGLVSHATSQRLPEILILLDGSWKQARGLYLSNPWLHTLPHFHFDRAPTSQYAIRHTKLAHSLSTLEAVAYSLNCLHNTNVQPLYTLQQALLENWQGPKEHRR